MRGVVPSTRVVTTSGSEQVEVEGMNMTEMEGTNIVEKHDHPTKYRLGEEGMNMVEHYHPTKRRLEVEDMYMVSIHMVEVAVWIWWKNITN
jgi:hypothetical protein